MLSPKPCVFGTQLDCRRCQARAEVRSPAAIFTRERREVGAFKRLSMTASSAAYSTAPGLTMSADWLGRKSEPTVHQCWLACERSGFKIAIDDF